MLDNIPPSLIIGSKILSTRGPDIRKAATIPIWVRKPIIPHALPWMLLGIAFLTSASALALINGRVIKK